MSVHDTAPLPDACLRGIRLKKYVEHADVISFEAFLPNEKKLNDAGHSATSVNWEDDADAIATVPEQHHGIARILTSDLKHLIERGLLFAVERAPLVTNRYHGNIVFPRGTKAFVRTLANGLAMYAKKL